MKIIRKLQVFISSTFTDLREERKAAVEAILSAGHIPAGMELFAAGDKAQLQIIRKWIDESDVFLLILGERYGSIEPESLQSYVHLEYLYAIEKQMPLFSIVMRRVADHGQPTASSGQKAQYDEFAALVRSKICRDCDDCKDVKIAVLESIRTFLDDSRVQGWVPGSVLTERDRLAQDCNVLSQQVQERDAQLARFREEQKVTFNGLTLQDLKAALHSTKIAIPPFIPATGPDGKQLKQIDLLNLFLAYGNDYAIGPSNSISAGKAANWMFEIGSHFVKYGLIEVQKPDRKYRFQIARITSLGNRFLAEIEKARVDAQNLSGESLRFGPAKIRKEPRRL